MHLLHFGYAIITLDCDIIATVWYFCNLKKFDKTKASLRVFRFKVLQTELEEPRKE
jgi:hypothetical protein